MVGQLGDRRPWRDIWLHEGFACYAEWLWSEHRGGDSADVLAERHRQALLAGPQDLVVADPGARDMFDDRVYKRGALALHALRRAFGDTAFTAALRDLGAAHRHGSVAPTDVYAAFAAAAGTTELAVRRVTGPWIDEPGVPGAAATDAG